MKQRLFTIFATLLCCMSMFAGGDPEEPELEVYTEFVGETGTLTYYYDTKRLERSGVTEQYNPDASIFLDFYGYAEKVKKAVIDPSMKKAPLTSMEGMFYGIGGSLSNMTTIKGLKNLNTTNVTNMSFMFKECSELTSLDLSSFNTENVTDMHDMFYCCSRLSILNLSSFNTENVTNMSEMFGFCSALTSLDLSSFNTKNVTDMSYLFDFCSALTSLDLSSFNTENVTNMSNMFVCCSALTSLNLTSFNTENVKNMTYMFYNCSALTSLDLSSFNTENVTEMNNMFSGCEALTSLDLSSFNTENVQYMNNMLSGCRKLKTIYCNNDWSTSSAESDYEMFYECKKLVGGKGTKYNDSYIDKYYARPDGGTESPGYFTLKYVYTKFVKSTGTLTFFYDSKFDESNPYHELYDPDATRFAGYYDKVTKAVIDPSMKNAPLTSMAKMFVGGAETGSFKIYSLPNLTTIEGLENLNTSNVTDMTGMFGMCQSLTSLDLSSFNTSNVTNMSAMFMGCNALKIVDLTSFDVSKVTTVEGMFNSCSELTTICCNTDWRTSPALTKSNSMFSNCDKIVGDKGTTFVNDKDVTYAHPDGGKSDPGYFSLRLKGDADGNGVVNAADIVAISNYMMGNPPTGFSKASADVNLDGIINIADIVGLANILLSGK